MRLQSILLVLVRAEDPDFGPAWLGRQVYLADQKGVWGQKNGEILYDLDYKTYKRFSKSSYMIAGIY